MYENIYQSATGLKFGDLVQKNSKIILRPKIKDKKNDNKKEDKHCDRIKRSMDPPGDDQDIYAKGK